VTDRRDVCPAQKHSLDVQGHSEEGIYLQLSFVSGMLWLLPLNFFEVKMLLLGDDIWKKYIEAFLRFFGCSGQSVSKP